MFYHYLLVKLKEPEQRATAAEGFRRSMEALVPNVPGLEGCKVSSTQIPREDGIDLVIRMDFLNREALLQYLDSDLHQAAKVQSGDNPAAYMRFFDSEDLI